MPDECKHMKFSALVTVSRLEDTGQFMAEVRMHCVNCALPFQFLGLEPGLDMNGARVSIDGLKASIAICPLGKALSPLDSIMVASHTHD